VAKDRIAESEEGPSARQGSLVSGQPAPAARPSKPPPPVKVVVTDLDISFGQMVILLVKLALAAIPALSVLAVIGAVVAGFFVAFVQR